MYLGQYIVRKELITHSVKLGIDSQVTQDYITC